LTSKYLWLVPGPVTVKQVADFLLALAGSPLTGFAAGRSH
jgi:hypothetical protein